MFDQLTQEPEVCLSRSKNPTPSAGVDVKSHHRLHLSAADSSFPTNPSKRSRQRAEAEVVEDGVEAVKRRETVKRREAVKRRETATHLEAEAGVAEVAGGEVSSAPIIIAATFALP